jgi:hypothetical protein
LYSEFGIDSFGNFLNHGFNKTVCSLSDWNSLIDLVLEAAEIYLLDKRGINSSKFGCLLLNISGLAFDRNWRGVGDCSK